MGEKRGNPPLFEPAGLTGANEICFHGEMTIEVSAKLEFRGLISAALT